MTVNVFELLWVQNHFLNHALSLSFPLRNTYVRRIDRFQYSSIANFVYLSAAALSGFYPVRYVLSVE